MPLPRSRNDVIRTRDLFVPNEALYQAEPHSDALNRYKLSVPKPCLYILAHQWQKVNKNFKFLKSRNFSKNQNNSSRN